jgi:diguanylate cyclase (GGDEF)-like protein
LRFSAEEGIIMGIGVLMFFLGLWTDTAGVRYFCFALTIVAFYYSATSLWAKMKRRSPSQIPAVDEDEALSALKKKMTISAVAEEPVKKSEPEPVLPELEGQIKPVDYPEPEATQRKAITYQISDFVDIVEFRTSDPMSEQKAEFKSVIEKLLSVMKEVFFAHSVAFFWIKKETNQLVLEARATDSAAFLSERKFTLGDDWMSQVARSGQPEVVSNIAANAEQDIIPYYAGRESIRSCIAVPVFYPTSDGTRFPIGIVFVDSREDDAFGQETLLLAGKFTKTLSSLIHNWTEKYDLMIDASLLKADQRLRQRISADSSIPTIVNALAEEISGLVQWDALTVTLYDHEIKQWKLANVRTRLNERYVTAKQVIDFQTSIIGTVIKQNTIQIVNDLSASLAVRFFPNEQVNGLPTVGSFAAIPIATSSKCYGALSIESRERNAITAKDTAVVLHLASLAAMSLEIHEATEIIKEFVVVDETTGVNSRKFLLQRLEEELRRSDDTGTDMSFVLLTVSALDELTARFGKGAGAAALSGVAGILRSSIRAYDVVGRFDLSSFGVILVNTTANEAYLWAEKIRSTIASSVLTYDQKSYSVTVTVGICGATDGMTKEECSRSAEQVLQSAAAAGGNIVRVR